ncbi:MAG: hypothetical protein QME60_02750 [Verrucomicrobiota bacterium]|nr:hypothetical protein [Verrucomicrobiota bacterium]
MLEKSVPSRPAPPPAGEPAETTTETTSFAFTNRAETVTADQIKAEDKTSTVTADFNLDGLSDPAVVDLSEDDTGQQVAIYIQKQPDKPEAPPTVPAYYKGGVIRQPTEGKIMGVLTRQREGYTDLILLVSRAADKPEMMHYRNDGLRFSVAALRRKAIGSQLARENPPLDDKIVVKDQ